MVKRGMLSRKATPTHSTTSRVFSLFRAQNRLRHLTAHPPPHLKMPVSQQLELFNTPKRPSKGHLKARLDIAAMLLRMAKYVPLLVPEAGCVINLDQQLRLVKELRASRRRQAQKKRHSSSTGEDVSGRKQALESDPQVTSASGADDTMFSHHLEDSSAVFELRDPSSPPMATPSTEQSSSIKSTAPGQSAAPLLIHGHSVEEYRAIFRSVMSARRCKRRKRTARRRPNPIGRGRTIKRRLWEALSRPCLEESVDTDGLVTITETCKSSKRRTGHQYILRGKGKLT
ncbi:uncharacterized protein LOC134451382 [Engraulis encrasicolus]|uniref:uncharacterized protein LOC134451382 n=1 Tax=Engraulis encrasicolus TaxID=184585 RepID=UPI002FD4FBB0